MGTSHLGLKLMVTWEIRYTVPCDNAVWLGGHRWEAPVVLPGTIWVGGLSPLSITVNIPGLLMCENEWISWTRFPSSELEEEEASMPFGDGAGEGSPGTASPHTSSSKLDVFCVHLGGYFDSVAMWGRVFVKGQSAWYEDRRQAPGASISQHMDRRQALPGSASVV